MKIAIIGYGNVGKAFHELIEKKSEELSYENLEIKVTYILGKDGGAYCKKGLNFGDKLDFNKNISIDTIKENDDIDLMVEMTPTNIENGEPGLGHIKLALEMGVNVVTSNKGPILVAYRELSELARYNGVQLGRGCTTGGALPAINAGITDLAGANIYKIEGILNGTTNFILEEMENNGIDYKTALKKAQKLGIAETEPTLDVEGWDTATKLLILGNVLMGGNLKLSDISVKGITNISPEDVNNGRENNKKYKLIGKLEKFGDEIIGEVSPILIDSSNPLFNVNGKNKAVKYYSDTLGELTIIGGASGLEAAAASILRDIINIHRGAI